MNIKFKIIFIILKSKIRNIIYTLNNQHSGLGGYLFIIMLQVIVCIYISYMFHSYIKDLRSKDIKLPIHAT